MLPKELEHLKDTQNELDDRKIDIDRVGVRSLRYPMRIRDKAHAEQHTIASASLTVDLPRHFKGTHMSRFIEVLNARRGEITIRNMPSILTDIQTRLEANDAHIEMTFPYFVSKRAPVSGVESLMEYTCTFRAAKRGQLVDFLLAVRVPVKSLCPCSKAISDRGAHNQRSLVDVEIRSSDFIWIEDVVAAVERCASAPLYALLKREDEKYVTELAYDNPKFVEDLVRDSVIALRSLPSVYWLRVAAENQESIHNHSAFAEIEWSAEDAQERQEPLRFPDSPSPSIEPFGNWLRLQRAARNYSQQEFADLLGISAAHLSRVESGEKRLSEHAARRAGELLGADPDETLIRAGVVSAELQQLVAEHAREFMRWVRARSRSA